MSDLRRVRIESDGTPYGVKVFDSETGEVVPGVLKVAWEAGWLPGEEASFPATKLTLVLSPIVVEGDAQIMAVCAHCAAVLPPFHYGGRVPKEWAATAPAESS